MQLPFSIYLALKYLRPKRTFVSVVTIISILGVTLGVAVLVVVLSVMSGFDEMWRDKILGFNAHIQVDGIGPLDDPEELLERMARVEGVVAAAPYIQNLGFVQVGERVAIPVVKGVDPELERGVSRIPEHIVDGVYSLEYDEAVIGGDLARQLGVVAGDRILVHSPEGFTDPDQIYLPEELTIAGIFELGMYEFDIGFLLTSLDTARDLGHMDEGVHGIQIMTVDPLAVGRVADALRQAIGPQYRVRTWESMNRQLFAALHVEKNLMFLLLLFITLVAAFSICNTLITVTVQKTREIGLLKAVGFTPGHILRVFLWQGWIQGVLGTACGIGLGMLVLRYRNDLLTLMNRRLSYELLPKELYHLSEIPSVTSRADLLIIAASVMVICTVAAWIPAHRAARLEPARALRYE
jgi:lipoprotein-releasing system permease protein